MTMLQHYYTSCKKGTSSTGGFQCKAMSPGIHPEDLKVVNSILSYRIPSSLEPKDINGHPVAFRYQYFNGDKAILICSQSNGPDELGRPGNYFAHTVITSAQDFDLFPPILFWGHSFWRTQDSSDSLEIPPQSSFDLEPSLDFDRIWSFLDQGERRAWFYKLLCAVVHYDKSKRPIVILDSNENIAMWIMAVTFALPRAYRPFLTFATYHHDPYQAPFMIIGTTADSRFRFSQDEYISHFILNAENNRISDADDSVYARFVSDRFDAKAYDEKLLDFFELCQELIPRVTNRALAQKLDVAANFYLTVREKQKPSNTVVYESLEMFLREIEQRPAMGEYMTADLVTTATILREDLANTPSEKVVQQYGRTLHLLKRYDSKFAYRSPDDLVLILKLIIANNESLANQLLHFCRETHSQDNLVDAANRPEFIRVIITKLPTNSWQTYYLIWQYLGPLFQANSHNKSVLTELIHKTLAQIERLPTAHQNMPSSEAKTIVDALIHSLTGSQENFLLSSVAAWKQQSTGSGFIWFYTMFVARSPVEKREGYRRYIQTINSNLSPDQLILYEVEYDLQTVSPADLVTQIEKWLQYTADQPQLQKLVAVKSLETTWTAVPLNEKKTVAGQLLLSEIAAPYLDQKWTIQLLATYLSTLSFQQLTGEAQKLYEKYLAYPALTAEQRALIGGSLALNTGKFYGKSVVEVQIFLSRLDDEGYRREVEKLIHRFFAPKIDLDAHLDLLQAVYVQQRQQIFWELYWHQFKILLLDPGRIRESITLMSFWFDESLPILSEQPYLGPTFFLQLPVMLEELKNMKDSRRGRIQFDSHAAKHKWYPLISYHFQDKKSLFGLLHR